MIIVDCQKMARHLPAQLLKFTYGPFGTKRHPRAAPGGSVPPLCRQVAKMNSAKEDVLWFFMKPTYFVQNSEIRNNHEPEIWSLNPVRNPDREQGGGGAKMEKTSGIEEPFLNQKILV